MPCREHNSLVLQLDQQYGEQLVVTGVASRRNSHRDIVRGVKRDCLGSVVTKASHAPHWWHGVPDRVESRRLPCCGRERPRTCARVGRRDRKASRVAAHDRINHLFLAAPFGRLGGKLFELFNFCDLRVENSKALAAHENFARQEDE